MKLNFFHLMIYPLSYQQGLKQLFYNYNRSYTISRACLDLQYHQPITLPYNKENLVLTLELLLDYWLVYQIVYSNPR